MGAFKQAIERIDDINIDATVKHLVAKAFLLFDEYFTANNLYDAFDVDMFFEKYLFKTNYKENQKLKIKYSLAKDYENYTNNYNEQLLNSTANYIPQTNEMYIKEITPEEFLDGSLNKTMYGTLENFYLKSIIHDFIHFLTFCGNITYTDENNKNKTIPSYLETTKNKYLVKAFNLYYANLGYIEAATEVMASKVLKITAMPAYHELYKSLNFLHTTFDIKFEKNFLRRNLNEYSKSLSSLTMLNFMKSCDLLVTDLLGSTIEQIQQSKKEHNFKKTIQGIITDALNEYSLTIYNTAEHTKPNQFIIKQTQILLDIPYLSTMNFEDLIKRNNEVYVEKILSLYQVEPKEQRVEQLANLIQKTIMTLKNISIEEYIGAKNSVQIKTSDNNIINFYITDNTLSFSDTAFCEKHNYYKPINLININDLNNINFIKETGFVGNFTLTNIYGLNKYAFIKKPNEKPIMQVNDDKLITFNKTNDAVKINYDNQTYDLDLFSNNKHYEVDSFETKFNTFLLKYYNEDKSLNQTKK